MKNPGVDGCTFINAAIGGRDSSLRIEAGKIHAIGAAPQADDVVIDLRGDRLLPGLINAHDHLQLNNFPRLKYRERYESVSQWIADIDTQRATDPAIAESARGLMAATPVTNVIEPPGRRCGAAQRAARKLPTSLSSR